MYYPLAGTKQAKQAGMSGLGCSCGCSGGEGCSENGMNLMLALIAAGLAVWALTKGQGGLP